MKKNAALKGLTSVGSPSLLCIYEADGDFDRVTLEPVSNLNLLTGAVRGASGSSQALGGHISRSTGISGRRTINANQGNSGLP